MKNLECIFTDLDGTLLDSNHKIMPLTRQILCDLYRKSVTIIPVSARMPVTITTITDAISTKMPIITYNGAYVIDEDKIPLLSLTIEGKTACEIYNNVAETYPDVVICAYYENDWIVDDINDKRIQTEIQAVGFEPRQIPVLSYIESTKKLHKLFIIGTHEQTDVLTEKINKTWTDVAACKSSDIFIEITSCQASKGNAVKQFAQMKKINLDKSVAFGDHINDIDMLMAVGMGVAMGNSDIEVIKAARHITDTNNNEGVYKFLTQYINN